MFITEVFAWFIKSAQTLGLPVHLVEQATVYFQLIYAYVSFAYCVG